nr:phosphoribosylformylglycinamidine synthase subunit PurQ [Armatimonadota bacterium]
RLREFGILAIPGGFTYGDDVSAGRILANEMRSLMEDQVREFIGSGKLALGICNGFQMLVKAGLLPGPRPRTPAPPPSPPAPNFGGEAGGEQSFAPVDGLPEQSVTLAENLNGRFQCRWVRLRVREGAAPPFLAGMDGQVLEVPIAHGEGRFCASPETLERIEAGGQVALQYCGPDGRLDDRHNVNGSALHAAGISGYDGRVLGLMPHPERYVHGTQHPRWTREGLRTEGQGLAIFRNAVQWASRAG